MGWVRVIRPGVAGIVMLLIMQAAAAGDGYSIQDIGGLDCQAANRKLTEGIEAGSAEAAFTTAQMMARRVCFTRDLPAVADLLGRAAAKGHRPAMQDLAYAHALGEGVPQDYAVAGAWLRKVGIEPHSPMDDYTLGYAWAKGMLVRRYSGQTTPFWNEFEHRIRARLTVDTRQPAPTFTLERVGEVPPGAEDEARRVFASVHRDMNEALRRGAAKLPAPKTERLSAGVLHIDWVLFAPKSTGNKARAVESLDAMITR
jgi:TPR repeat protein